MFDLLRRLTQTPGGPGLEDEIRSLVRGELEAHVDEVRMDRLGNLDFIKRGSGDGPVVMIAAHMDQIGFMATHIDKNGYIRLNPTGGFDPRTMMNQRVMVYGKKPLPGVMGSKPKHILTDEELKKPLKVKDYFVDVGLPGDTVKELVQPGDRILWMGDCIEMGEMYCSRAMDDRIGVLLMIEAMKRVKNPSATIHAVATVQEEVGIRGAWASAAQIKPDIGLALDVTIANDVPGSPEHEAVTRMGDGIAVKMMDGASISSIKLVRHLEDIADANDIKHQREILPAGGTDAGAIWRVPGGAHVCTLSVPSRYVHSTVELVHKDDVDGGVKLLAAWLEVVGERDYA
ncbi:M42 family metallopeptidase [bacterium]|nr:M42 family metallopeptidase [bacterium]